MSNRILEKDEVVFYALSDNDEYDGFNEIKQKNDKHKEINSGSKKRLSKRIMKVVDENTPFNTTSNLAHIKLNNKFYDPLYLEKRKSLPVKKKELKLNVWNILKDAVGKDLSKFCVPGKKRFS
jgi:hypothetical protein